VYLLKVFYKSAQKEPINYSKFDCSTFALMPSVKVIPKKLTIIEGAYSMHPVLADYVVSVLFLVGCVGCCRNRCTLR